MIYNEATKEYKVKFYKDIRTGHGPVLDYIKTLGSKEEAKALKYIEFLRINKGYLDEPYSKYIKGKIRELRVDFSHNRHRVLLHAFLKKTAKTPMSEIREAEENCKNVINNSKIYE